jgi:hypothetical protein
MAGLSDVSLEPVIEFNLQWQVTHSVLYHGSSADMLPLNKSSETVEIVGGQQHVLHTDISLEQLEEIMLAKAVDYFRHNDEPSVYQMIWRSKHGAARIHVEKPSINTRRIIMRAQRTSWGRLQMESCFVDRIRRFGTF